MLPRPIQTHLSLRKLSTLIVLTSGLISTFFNPRVDGFPFEPHRSQHQLQANAQTATEDWGRPKRRTSGGDRNLCQVPLVAIIPGEGEISLDPNQCGLFSRSIGSVTAMPSPTLWFYIPPSLIPEFKGELVLLEKNRPVHRQHLSLPATGGIVPVKLGVSLAANIQYDWQFSILIDPNHPTENPTVESSIEYNPLPLDFSRQLASLEDPIDQAKIQLAQNRWQDGIHTLAHHYCLQHQQSQSQEAWQAMLKQLELSELEGASFHHCHSPTPDSLTAKPQGK